MSIAIKLNKYLNSFFKLNLAQADKELYKSIEDEFDRQQNHIELIASENIVSKAVLEAQGSVLTNKYAEGYPGKRYYGGCEHVDQSENLAIERAKELFNCKFANVQPHSGAQANGLFFNFLLNTFQNELAFNQSIKSLYLVLSVILGLMLYLIVCYFIKAFQIDDIKLKY